MLCLLDVFCLLEALQWLLEVLDLLEVPCLLEVLDLLEVLWFLEVLDLLEVL